MSRLLVLALIFSLSGASSAFAADTLLDSARRAATTLARTRVVVESHAAANSASKSLSADQQTQPAPGLESSGLRKRTKILIAIGAALGYAGVAYTIDHHVVNNTPSTLGTRKD
jgi:hypothetical protein